MAIPGLPLLLSRPAGAARPWLGRKPAEWTPADIQAILNESAWVRQVPLGMERPASATSRGEGPQGTAPLNYTIVVRWESGLPVRLARRNAALPEKYSGRYVLSVGRLPLGFIAGLSGKRPARGGLDEAATRAEVVAQIGKTACLEPLGRDVIRAAAVEWVSDSLSAGILVSFTPPQRPIRLEDGEVTLSAQAGLLSIRARFSLKQMVYNGRLEL
jgi:hypothetical protein